MGRVPIFDDVNAVIDDAAYNAVRAITNAGRDVVCSIRAQYPKSFSTLPFDKALSRGLCSGFGQQPPEPEQQIFTGGQCEGVAYLIDVRFSQLVSGGARQGGFQTIGTVAGPISGVDIRISPTNPSLEEIVAFVNPDATYPDGDAVLTQASLSSEIEIESVTVVRQDGLPDDCGDPEPLLPPDPPRNPDDFRRTVPICEEDEQGNPINCIDVEVVLPEEDEYKFPICIVVDGRKICYGPDGWTIEDGVTTSDKEEEEEEEEEEEIEVLDYVLVVVNQLPTKFNKRIVREDKKDTEIFAGYLAWAYIRDGVEYFLPAIPIRKERNAFKPPEGIENYSVYFNFELTGTVTEVKKTIKVPKQPVESPV